MGLHRVFVAASLASIVSTFAFVANAGPDGTACTAPAECDSGFCVDGVCCANACAGQCEACDVAGAAGKCSGVTGAPHGTREKCAEVAGNICATLTCAPADRTKCSAFAYGAEQTCSTTTCTGTTLTEASSCDGKGKCKPQGTSSCAPYACRAGSSCATSCSFDGDCAPGSICRGAACVAPGGGKCSDDKTEIVYPDGRTVSCTPYNCDPVSTLCLATCVRPADCGAGYVCDTAKKQCVANTPAPASGGGGGGCAIDHGEANSGFSLAMLLGVVALSRRRRASR